MLGFGSRFSSIVATCESLRSDWEMGGFRNGLNIYMLRKKVLKRTDVCAVFSDFGLETGFFFGPTEPPY